MLHPGGDNDDNIIHNILLLVLVADETTWNFDTEKLLLVSPFLFAGKITYCAIKQFGEQTTYNAV